MQRYLRTSTALSGDPPRAPRCRPDAPGVRNCWRLPKSSPDDKARCCRRPLAACYAADCLRTCLVSARRAATSSPRLDVRRIRIAQLPHRGAARGLETDLVGRKARQWRCILTGPLRADGAAPSASCTIGAVPPARQEAAAERHSTRVPSGFRLSTTISVPVRETTTRPSLAEIQSRPRPAPHASMTENQSQTPTCARSRSRGKLLCTTARPTPISSYGNWLLQQGFEIVVGEEREASRPVPLQAAPLIGGPGPNHFHLLTELERWSIAGRTPQPSSRPTDNDVVAPHRPLADPRWRFIRAAAASTKR